jgi:hypothetical protein
MLLAATPELASAQTILDPGLSVDVPLTDFADTSPTDGGFAETGFGAGLRVYLPWQPGPFVTFAEGALYWFPTDDAIPFPGATDDTTYRTALLGIGVSYPIQRMDTELLQVQCALAWYRTRVARIRSDWTMGFNIGLARNFPVSFGTFELLGRIHYVDFDYPTGTAIPPDTTNWLEIRLGFLIPLGP